MVTSIGQYQDFEEELKSTAVSNEEDRHEISQTLKTDSLKWSKKNSKVNVPKK